jgi:DNA-binding GntR family transcriptional regulator
VTQAIDFAALAKNKNALKKRNSLADNTVDILREMILLEKLEPGTPLPERDISAAMGISRTPLREAIQILEREGLIEYSPSRRPSVANPTIEEITDYLRIQGALEALAGELACANASDQELANVSKLNQEMLDMNGEDDPLVSFERDMFFHSAIVAASHNLPLVETHSNYNARLWRARFLSSQRHKSRNNTRQEHQEIVDALLSRNSKAASQALQHHLTTAVSNIAKALEEKAEDFQEAPSDSSLAAK